ncbi:aquaporin TIP4-1 [Trifolium repens]|nr:aquaporin TIP4-1 [Trifolium repens]
MIHQPIPTHTLASGIGYIQGVVWEIVLTFSLLFTVYATMVDPKKGALSGLGPLLIGFVVGANIMAGGAFSGNFLFPPPVTLFPPWISIFAPSFKLRNVTVVIK